MRSKLPLTSRLIAIILGLLRSAKQIVDQSQKDRPRHSYFWTMHGESLARSKISGSEFSNYGNIKCFA